MGITHIHDAQQASCARQDYLLCGRYRLLEVVGDGGFSTVWRAEVVQPTSWPSIVAIKQSKQKRGAKWPQAMKAAFERECTLLRFLSHPYVPRLHDYFVFGEQQYLVMDFVAGESLEQRLNHERVSIGVALQWGYSLCQMMAYLHRCGITYRDMKPANILVPEQAQGFLVLVDFGLAFGSDSIGSERSNDLSQFGTYEYAAPEQLQGEVATQFSDVYSLAVVLFYLLTGINPVQYRPTPGDALALRYLSGITEELAALFAQMLSENPEHRPDMNTIAQALLEWSGSKL